MASVTITNPANNGDNMPDTVEGTYQLQLAARGSGSGPPVPVPLARVDVTFTQTDDTTKTFTVAATLDAPAAGDWQATPPGVLVRGKKYDIDAVIYVGASTTPDDTDTKSNIQN